MPLQENHNMMNFLLVEPGFFYALNPCLPQAGHLAQPVRVTFKDVKCLQAESLDNPGRISRTDALDQPGAKITLHAVNGVWFNYLTAFQFELSAIPGIRYPGASQREGGTDWYSGKKADNRNQFLFLFQSLYTSYSIAVFFILEGDPVEYSPNLSGGSWRSLWE